MSDQQIRALFEDGQLRGRSARRHAPHDCAATDAVDADHPAFLSDDGLQHRQALAAREEINAAAPKDKDGKPAYKLSVNDFVIKALALALQRVPDANVSWTEGGMLKHKHSDVGVAVAMPGGLITPIIRHAESKSLSSISNEMKDLAARARARKLKPQEYQGGTTSVSNLGMYGIKDFTAVINPPQATILAVGAGEERAVVKQRQDRSRPRHERDAVVRPSRGRRRARRRADRRVQGADRKSGDDGGVRCGLKAQKAERRMRRTRRDILKGAAAAGAAALLAPAAFAQSQFPNRTIRIVVPFPAGATTDMLARLIANRLTETMGQSFVVENVGGGGGSIGADQVAKAAPDGHTLLFHNITFSTTTSSLLYAKRARHDFDDFVPISVGAYVPLLLLANPSVPANNLKEFVEYAKTATTPLFYGSTGPGSIMHLMGEVLKRDTGIKMDHIPYRGAAPLVTDLVAGRVQFAGDQLSSSLERVRTGQLKAIGGGHEVSRAAKSANHARTWIPQSRTAGLERLPRPEGHARTGDRALTAGDRGCGETSRRAKAHDRCWRRAIRFNAGRDARHATPAGGSDPASGGGAQASR